MRRALVYTVGLVVVVGLVASSVGLLLSRFPGHSKRSAAPSARSGSLLPAGDGSVRHLVVNGVTTGICATYETRANYPVGESGPVPPKVGAWFSFAPTERISFWMRDTAAPLVIYWVRGSTVTGSLVMEAESLVSHPMPAGSTAAVELPPFLVPDTGPVRTLAVGAPCRPT